MNNLLSHFSFLNLGPTPFERCCGCPNHFFLLFQGAKTILGKPVGSLSIKGHLDERVRIVFDRIRVSDDAMSADQFVHILLPALIMGFPEYFNLLAFSKCHFSLHQNIIVSKRGMEKNSSTCGKDFRY